MKKAILGIKVGMTQIFAKDGTLIPVTVVEAGPCTVIRKKTVERDGYSALCVGFGEIREKRVNSPLMGEFEKAGVTCRRYQRELPLESADSYEVGQDIKADMFTQGDWVDVTGKTRGHGFTGVINLWDAINEAVILPVFTAEANAVTRLAQRKGRLGMIALAMVLVLLSNSKRAGIALSIWIVAGVLLSFFPVILRWVLAHGRIGWYCLTGILVAMGLCLFSPFGQQSLIKAEVFVENMASLQRIGDWEWVSEVQRKGMPNLTRLKGFGQFLASSFSEGTIVPTDVNPKVPLAFTAKERSVFYHGFAGPWFGGFGPWFALALLMAAGLLLIRPMLLQGLPRGVGFWMLWLWVPLLLLPGIFSRWIPWMWLFPVLCAVSYDYVVSSARSRSGCSAPRTWWLSSRSIWVHGFGIVTLCVLILNSGVVWGLNVAGHIRSSGILNEQLEFLATQADKPLDVYFKDFPSNRTWLDQVGIPYSPTLAPVPDRWQLRLYRSTTIVFLPAGLCPDDAVVIGGRSVLLRDLASRWDSRGKGDPSWPWIGSSLIEPIKAKNDPIRSGSGRRPKQSQ